MFELILIDRRNGRRLVWRPSTDAETIEIANALMALPLTPVADVRPMLANRAARWPRSA